MKKKTLWKNFMATFILKVKVYLLSLKGDMSVGRKAWRGRREDTVATNQANFQVN